jgi:hypothetical protein
MRTRTRTLTGVVAALVTGGVLLSGCAPEPDVAPVPTVSDASGTDAAPGLRDTMELEDLQENPSLTLAVGQELRITTGTTVDTTQVYSSNPTVATLTHENPTPKPTTLTITAHSPGGTFLVIPERFPDTHATVITLHTHAPEPTADTPSPN